MKEYAFLCSRLIDELESLLNDYGEAGWRVHTFDVDPRSALAHGRRGTEAWALVERDKMPEPTATEATEATEAICSQKTPKTG